MYQPQNNPYSEMEYRICGISGLKSEKFKAGYISSAFFMHFDENHKVGSAAAAKHIEYFDYTDMDFAKIQYEQHYTPVDYLKKPADWAKMTPRKLDFYEPQLQTVREIVKAKKKEALIVMTLYSPFMWAGHCATLPVLLQHMEENPDAVKKGLDVLTESLMLFAQACIETGVDGTIFKRLLPLPITMLSKIFVQQILNNYESTS